MNSTIPTISILMALIVMSAVNTQAFSQNTNVNVTSDQSFNQLQAGGLQGSENVNATLINMPAIDEFKKSLQNQQDVTVTNLPSINTTTEETRAGIFDYDGKEIPIFYQPLGNVSANANEGYGLFEGDILLSNEASGGKIAPDRFITTSKWTNGIIPVYIHPDTPNKNNILDAMLYVMDKTEGLVIFTPAQITENRIVDPNYLVFLPSQDKCASALGMQGGGQAIVVPTWCKTGSLVHEIGHTLGIWHEQTRCDRDQSIKIVWENINEEWKDQFTSICDPQRPEESPVSFGEYDLCSIMHYPVEGVTAAIDPDQPIMVPLKEPRDCSKDDIGQRNGYSPLDIEGIKALYPF